MATEKLWFYTGVALLAVSVVCMIGGGNGGHTAIAAIVCIGVSTIISEIRSKND